MTRKFVNLAVICGFAAVLAGCAPSPEAQLESEVRTAMKLVLKDPGSAQFSDVVRHGKAVCGFVNGKNSLGAYSGNRAFVLVDYGVNIDDPGDAKFSKLVRENCPLDFSVKQIGMALRAVSEDLETTK